MHQGTVVFPVKVTFNNVETSGEVLADVLEADLNLSTHVLTTATIGVPVTVPIQIQNGGLGEIDSLDFVITEMGMTTTNVVVNGIPSTLISNIAGVRRYRIYSNALPGGKLNNPETITVLRTVVVQSCVFSSNYATNWGCNGTLCQTPEPFGPGEFVLTSGSPNVQMTANVVQASNLCTNSIVDITYTNNGSGPSNAAAAFNMIFKAGMNTATGWSSSNWSTVSVTMNGNPVTYTGGSSGAGISFNANQFSSDPDGAGGLADVDLDGKFDDLPKGASITLRITLAYTCPTACPAPNETANLISGAMYADQCGAMLNSVGPGGFLFSNSANGNPVLYAPNTVSDGQTFNAEICLSRVFGGAGLNCPTNKIKFALTLPAAVTATGVGFINGVPATVTTVGNIATVEGAFQSGTGMCISIEMTYSCSADPINFSYEVSYQCDVACACIQKWACGNFAMSSVGCIESASCPDCPPCPDGGLSISALRVQRTTLGYTDHTGTTRVTNPGSLPALSLLKAMPCDTLKFTMSSEMDGGDSGAASFDNAYLEISYDRLSGNNLLGYGGGTYEYFDASTGNTTTGALPAPTNTVIAGRHVYIWNFNAFLPGNLMEPGDKITAFPRFVVLNNAALSIVPTKPSNALAAFFNLASSGGNPLPGGSPRFSCGSFTPEFYLHANKPQPLPVAGARSGCGSYSVTGAINNEVTILFDEYPGEIRPVEIIKSVKVQIQNGDSYDPSVQPVLIVYGSNPDDPWYTGTFNLPAPTIAGNLLTWTNPGNWPVSDMAGTDPAATGYAIQFNLKNSGCVNAADGTLLTTWNYDRFGYAVPACRLNVIASALSGTVGGGAPQHTLTNLTGTINGTKKIECFQVEVKNVTAGRESGYVWLALEDNLSPMDVVSVKYLGNPLPLISYSNGKWVKLANSLPGGASILLDVCVKYTNCSDNVMTLKQGWDCIAYPSNPTTYPCQVTQTTLRILPSMARVQGDFLATSPLPAMMCEDFVFNFRMNSSQKADLFNPAVKVTLPPNMALQGNTVDIEYPINSGIWQTVLPLIAGQVITVDLTAHTGINDTLPGTINADVVNFPLGQDRQAAVRFTVRTNCNYFSGDRISFQPMGNAACGGPAEGSGASFLSPRIRIFGAEPTYEGTFSINLGSPDNLYGCYAQKLDVTVQLADINAMDNLPASTGSADTIFLTLPSILDVVPGSFVCTTFPATNCPVFWGQTIDGNGRRVLKFSLPPNIPIPNGGVVPLIFSVMVQPQQQVACTVNDKITGSIIAVYNNIICPNPPPGSVCAKVQALAGGGETAVVIKKMELALEGFFIACSLNGQIQYTANIRVKNLPLAADSSFVVEIYCLDGLGQPLFLVETKTITGFKAVGSLTTITGSFAGCDPQNGVMIKIPLQTAAGDFQCHCAPIQQVSNNLPKCPSVVVTTPDNEICPYENATVVATLSGAASGGTWTSSGTGTFANNMALTTTYTPSAADKAVGTVTLTFTTNDLTGTCAPGVASVLITIRPLPVVATATLNVCASTLGGNSGVFNLKLADDLVDPQDVNVVTYHATQANANSGASPLSSPYTATNNTTIYARVLDPTTGCFNTTTVLLKVNPLPMANPASLSVCERPPFGSGVGLFNLNLATPTVNNGAGLTVTYHATLADAQADANALSNPHIANNGTIVYARVEINATGCYSSAQVTLNVLPSPVTYTHTLKVCAMGVGMIMAEFDLAQANTWVTTHTAAGPVPAGLAVTYHISYTDAVSDINPITSPFTSVTANVWVRVENTVTGCYSIDIVQLVVLPRPIAVILKTDESCPTAANGTVLAVPTSGQVNFTYDWSNDGPDNPDNDPANLAGLVAGTYTVTITDGNGCTSSTTTTIGQGSNICGSIGLAKRAVQTVLNADGSALVTYEFNLENLGGLNLNDISLIDNLSTTFPGTCMVTVTSLTSDDFIVNPAYNGTGNNNMLAINNDLPAGDKGAVLLTILVKNCGNSGPFSNTASTSGTPPFGPVVNDVSDDGSEPDANNNNFAGDPGEDTPTPVSFTPNPVIGVAKRNVKTELLPDGSANVTFEFNLENFGNVNLNNLTLTDNLAAAFPASCLVSVMSLTSDDFIVNPAFTGTGNNNMLATGNDLPVGDKGAVLLTVNVANCGAGQTSFVNTATATGTSPGGASVTDNSVNGSDPDGSDGDNNPDESSNTPVSFMQNPLLGVAKRNVQTVLNADGSANVTFEFNLENFGNVNLDNLTLTDNLTTAFPASCAVSVMSLTSDDFIVNPAFTGTGNNNMLAAGNDLPVGDKGAVLLTINVANCGASQNSFVNTATATGTSPGGTTVTDNSVNGADPDGTDGDNNPDESSNTPVSFIQNPVLGVAKRNVKTELLANGSANVTFEFNLENFGNVNLNNLTLTDNLSMAFPSTCVISVMSLTSDDFIVNQAFTGTGNNNLLAAGNDLPVGDKGAVLLTINVANCGADQTFFVNNASATGTSPGGTTVTDNSVNGSDPDGTDNDNNPDEEGGTPVSFAQNPLLGVAKRNVKTELLADGSANVSFEFNLENFGNVNLNNLTLTDNLATAFPASCSVSVMSLTSDDFIVNPSFTGTGNNNMLAAGNDLPVGDKGAVLLTINVANCGASQTSFVNTATATGTSPGGATVTDNAVNGSDPDGSDNDNNPDEESGTPVSFTQNPVLGVAKRNVKTELLSDGSANVTFEFNLENFGNVNLNALILTDNLATTFPASCAVTVMSLTSDDFIVNPSFNGTGNNNMLAAGNDLPVGDKGAVLLTINVANCGANQSSFVNNASTTGTSPGGVSVTDNSVNGSDPDGSDNDNNPDEESGTPVSFTQNPVLGVAKRNVKTELLADGSANVTLEFNLENFGNVNLNNLTLTDNLAAAFPASCAVTVMSLTSDDFIVNPAFNGTGNNNMLAAGNDLPVGDKGAVLLTINIANCAANQTSFINTATTTGTSPGGTTVTDISVNSADPDGTDGDNNPDEASGTPISFVQNPVLGVAKRNVQTVLNADGSANVTFEFNLENFGNVNLYNLTLTDNLAATFPASCVVSVASLTSDDFNVNASFNGTGNNNLLAPGNYIPVGQKGAVLLTVKVVNCASNQTSFINTAIATGVSPGGATVTDNSVNGSDADGANGDNNPDEASGTPVSFMQNPVLGVAKRNVKTELLADGSANVTFEFNLENFGNVNLYNLTLTDNLAATFPASCSVSVMSLTSDDFIVNPSFTGTGNNNMLAAGNDLPVGDKGAVLLTINVANCGASQTSFVNTATATGTSPGGATVADNSVNGADPDGTDGDNNPDEASGTLVSFTQNPVLGVSKRNVQTVLNADGSANVTFEFNLENFGNVNLNALTLTDNLATTFPASCSVTVMSLTSDDFIVNPSFTGTGNNNMLAAGNDLPVGDKGAVLLTINVANCGANQSSFVNNASASGTSPGGTTVTDNSVNGSDPDGSDNDNNPDEESGTPVSFMQNPILGVAKRNVQTVLNADGSANVTFEFNLENFGNVNLNNLTLIDNLAAAFPVSCAVTVTSLTSDDFIINTSFNGTGNNNLLAAGNNIPVGDKGAVLLTINVAGCGASQTMFTNSATATGTAPGGSTTTDVSEDGSDPDPNGNGNPGDLGENSPTPVSFTQKPVLGLTKRVSNGPILLLDNSYELRYEIKVFNLGNVDLNKLSVIENLAATFTGASSWQLIGIESEEFEVNTSYNGNGINELLATGNTLTVGNEGAIYVTVRVAPGTLDNSYDNTVKGTATSPGSATVTDISDDGTDPDTDDDGNPNELGENDPTPVDLPCFIGIICPAVVSPIVVQNDQEWCNAMVNFPPAVPVICAGAATPLIEYQLSGIGAENTLNGVWILGQPSGLRYRVGTTSVRIRARLGAVGAPGTLISTDCIFDITVLDKQAPKIQCPGGIYQFGTNAACTYVATAAINASATDNCAVFGATPPNQLLTLTYNLTGATTGTGTSLAGVVFNLGNTIIVWTANDNALPTPNKVTCAYTIVVSDDDKPVITNCPINRAVNTSVSGTGDCTATVPNLIPEVVAMDNCTPAALLNIVQVPAAGTTFGAQHGDQTTVTITVTDAAGNSINCLVVLTIVDNEPPIFTNCPTTMLMYGTDPDQCAAKVNWSAPTADDNCGGAVAIQQTAGPLPGSILSATCPPAPTTITYKATDARGLTSFCNFSILVVDTEKPEFDADIVMPNDTTVNCHQVPSNCVYHGPLICTALTNNDVNDNCTAPSNLVVTYKEVSTQNSNPAVCGYYKYNLTRTWTVKDCTDNALVHTQLIAVQDTTRPVALCKNATFSLDKTGKYILDPQTVNNGSFDNCAAFPYLTFSVSPNQFTCAELGPNLVTLTVTDPCGNSSTCQATVTVNDAIAPCTPEFQVVTNCMGMGGMGNATTMDNGQFMDLITIKSLAMQVWKLTANITNNGKGLYSITSSAPPATPVLLPVGTLFTAGTADAIDNDGDGTTDEVDEMIYYTLKAIHVDCQGYDISVSNQGAIGMGISATTTHIENKACYPNPYFSSLIDAPFCLGTPPFPILVSEYNNATGSIVPGSIMVDGVPTNVFNAAALGLGFHTVMATFDAGAATSNLIINGVQLGGSMADAVADPGCKQKITQIVQVLDTPNTLICNDLVYVSMDEDCKVTVLVDDVLEGTYYCFDDYLVEVDKTLPFGNGPWEMAMFGPADIGKTYFYHVTQTVGGSNVCWGQIKIEDKLAPKLDCPDNITIACSESTNVQHTGNVVVSDCSAYTTVIDDVSADFGPCSNPRGQILRTWIVTDAWGNQSSCSQIITITAFDLTHVVWPADTIVDCEVTYLNPAGIASVNTGEPSINGASIVGSTWCGAQAGFTDTYYYGCGGTFTILRQWGVLNNCALIGPGNPISHTQKIQVIDYGGPKFVCPPAVTVSSDPFQCCSTAALPDMIVSEGCSQILNLEAKVTGTNPNNGNIITFTVPGHLEDFPGNNYWNADTLAVFDYTQCLPLGTYNVRYSASDMCGNTSYCNFDLTIADLVPPAVACDQFTQVALTTDGMALVNASTFDDGTTDNCCIDRFEVRRMSPNPCQTDTAFFNQVKFCCSDIGDTILVVFRAWDCHDNYNDCMVSVLVEDKIKPSCNAPAQVAVDCENFDPSLWTYGKADVLDNCCLDTSKVYLGQIGLTHQLNYSLFDTVCNKGTIMRIFRVFDCAGNSSQCTQRIIVTYLQDYFVKFPNDAIVTVCDGTGNFGEPTFFGEDCELLGVSFNDQIFTVVPDACFKIERTWNIINWCTFNPNLPFIEVPNPNPNPQANHASNLPGPTVSECGTLAPWAPTVVKINATDPLATNYCTFWNQNANGYKYKQIVKIIDGQAPTGTYVTPACDNQTWTTPNNNALWNEAYWWDNGLQTHDLCEEPTDLCITATDACSGSNVNIEYLLFLDLDGDGVMETVINSVNTGIAGLGWNNVLFNNLNTPNFTGGTPQAFDARPVLNNMKWGFAIQETVVGNKKTACVRWNTNAAQNTYVVPELPHGTHKIKWLISDGCGNNKEYEYSFTVKDCKAPTVVCTNGLSVNIMPTAMIQLWASDFLQYTEDNCTPANQLKIGIRKCGTGTGFPVDPATGLPITSVTFNCTELGTQCVEIWAIDAAGNADYCETYVIVHDNLGNCPTADHINVAGALKTEMIEGVEEGTVHIDGTSSFAPPYSYFDLSDSVGIYAVTNAVPLAATFVIAPEKDDNPLNGVTTYDLVLISKHILGLEPLNSPYKMIAADANKSGSITTFDIVELRKLILGIYTELPNNTSWRFVDKSFSFPNILNPFQTLFPETISVADAMTTQAAEDFVGVKIGDVNNTAVVNATMQAEERTSGTAIFDLEDREVKAGEEFEVTFKSAQALKGFQFTILLHGLEVLGVQESDQITTANFGLVFQDAATVSIDGAQEFTLRFRAQKPGKLSEMLGVSGSITRAEAYLPAEASLPAMAWQAGAEEGRVKRSNIAFRFSGPIPTVVGIGFELYQNQPNPFVNRTSIGFYLPEATEATLSIYDESGRVVWQQRGQFVKGENTVLLDKALMQTNGGLYYQLETATDRATKKMIQMK